MTIIIATPALMAADSQENLDTLIQRGPKVFTHKGRIYGGAGSSYLIARWREAIINRLDAAEAWPSMEEEEFEGLEVGPDGMFSWSCWFQRSPLGGSYVAAGSGAKLAIGALDAGATLEEALAIVYRRDTGCSPPTVIVTLKDARKSDGYRWPAGLRVPA